MLRTCDSNGIVECRPLFLSVFSHLTIAHGRERQSANILPMATHLVGLYLGRPGAGVWRQRLAALAHAESDRAALDAVLCAAETAESAGEAASTRGEQTAKSMLPIA
jgi:hypothetical protein